MQILSKNDLLELASQLPTVSTAAAQLVGIIEDPNTTRADIVDLLKVDEILFAQCFKHANSAGFGSMKSYSTINEIVDVLGFGHIKKVALFALAKTVINSPKIWFESVFTATAAEFLARKNQFPDASCDAVYLAALFQNYGSFLFGHFYPEEYMVINKIVDFEDRLKAQKKQFGYNSLEVSSILMKDFKIPEYITKIIENQVNVYNSNSTKENVFIEIGRILQEMHGKSIEHIHETLEMDKVLNALEESRIELVTIDEDLVTNLKIQTEKLA